MLRKTETILFVPIALLVLIGSGCSSEMQKKRPDATTPETQDRSSAAVAQRFQDSPAESRTAVESAIELSEKYARLSDETAELREKNQQLEADNQHLLQQIETLEAKLKQTQKELGEANDLLIEMLTELNNWKSNILGFRGEMREAAKAQLEAMLKVLEILGGETEAGALQQRHAATLHPELRPNPEPNTPTMTPTGEANDN